MSGHEGCRGFRTSPPPHAVIETQACWGGGRGKLRQPVPGRRLLASPTLGMKVLLLAGIYTVEYLNRGVPTLGICIYRRRVNPRSPRWWLLPYTGTQEISKSLSSHRPGIWLVLCKQVRKKSPCKKKQTKPSLEEPSLPGSPGCLPQSSDGNPCPHSFSA